MASEQPNPFTPTNDVITSEMDSEDGDKIIIIQNCKPCKVHCKFKTSQHPWISTTPEPLSEIPVYENLFDAINNDKPSMLRRLIITNDGINVDTTNPISGQTALHHAAWKGRPECMKVLMDLGANIDAREHGNRTPLMIAADEDKPECVKLLVAKGADITATDRWGDMAVHYAVRKGSLSIVKLLIDKGQYPLPKDGRRQSCLALARLHGKQELVEWLDEYKTPKRTKFFNDLFDGI